MTTPRVRPAIQVALVSEVNGTKYTFADLVYADQRTVQRILRDLHREGYVRISGFAQHYKKLIPIYSKQSQEFPLQDAKAPKPIPERVRVKKYRASNPEFCIREAAKKRKKRAEQKCRAVSREEISEWLSLIRVSKLKSKARK